MLTPLPASDRVLALPCRLSTVRGKWLHLICVCNASSGIPIRSLIEDDSGAGARTLADTIIRLRCSGCGKAPARVWLAVDARPPGGAGAYEPAWSILLWDRNEPQIDHPEMRGQSPT